MNAATQSAIVFALSRLLDGEDVPAINLKKARQERPMLAQTEPNSKASLGGRNGRTDKSDGSDPRYVNLKKDLTLALREISNLKNQLNQAKENIAKERAERSSKSRKDGSPDAEVGGKRPRQHAKRAKASRPATSSPSPPRKGFRMLPTGDNIDSEEEEDYPESNARATYAVPRRSLLAFNHLSRRRLHDWRWSPDLSGQGQGKL